MSKVADKSATRSALKAKFFRGPRLHMVPKQTSSWWIDGEASDARETFIALAHERDRAAWSGVVPHAMNPRGNFS